MKKLLISIIIALMCILTVFTVIRGIHIGGFIILGLNEIKAEDEKLEKKVTEATKLASTDYPNELETIKKDMKDMEAEKEQYEDMIAVSTESEISSAIQKQNYSIDKLWTKIGSLATDEGLDAKFALTKGTLESASDEDFNYYTIEFEVTGSYVGVSLYISDLEDDSELGFRIEDFNMVPEGDGSTVTATFKTKDIAIQGIAKEETNEDEQNVEGTSEETEENLNSKDENTTTNSTTNTTTNTTENKSGSLLDSLNATVTDVSR